RERPLPVEVRSRDDRGEVVIESAQPEKRSLFDRNERARGEGTRVERSPRDDYRRERSRATDGARAETPAEEATNSSGNGNGGRGPVRVYAYGVARNRLYQAGRRLHVPIILVDDDIEADMIVTLKNYYRRRPKLIV